MITDEEYKKFLKVLELEPCLKEGEAVFVFSEGKDDFEKMASIIHKYEEKPKEE